MTRTITKSAIKNIGRALMRAFLLANEEFNVEPVFNEAAGEDDSGGFNPVEWHTGVLPGIRDSMTADNVSTRVLHNTRKESAKFSDRHLKSVHIS